VNSKKLILNYALLLASCIGLAACSDSNDSNTIISGLPAAAPATFFGDTTGSVTEDAEADSVNGTLNVNDVNAGESEIQSQADVALTYGSFSIGSSGSWVYTLDNANEAVQALNTGDTATDTVTVNSIDGTGQVITITVNGVDEPVQTPATFSGDVAATLDAGDTAGASGTVVVTDPDAGEAVIVAQTNTNGAYGSFSIGADGMWTYALDNSNTEVQELLVGATLTDAIAIASADGTASAVTITINGIVEGPTNNNAAVIRDTTGDTGELRYNLVLNSSGSTSSGRSIMDMRIKTNSFEFRDRWCCANSRHASNHCRDMGCT